MRRRTPEDFARFDARLLHFQQRCPIAFNAATVVIGIAIVLLGSWLAEVIEAIGR